MKVTHRLVPPVGSSASGTATMKAPSRSELHVLNEIMTKDLVTLQERLRTMEFSHEERLREVSDLREIKTKLEKDLEQASLEISRAEVRKLKAANELQELHTQLGCSKTEVNNFSVQTDTLRSKLYSKELELRRTTMETDQIRSTVDNQSKMIDHLKERIIFLEQRLFNRLNEAARNIPPLGRNRPGMR